MEPEYEILILLKQVDKKKRYRYKFFTLAKLNRAWVFFQGHDLVQGDQKIPSADAKRKYIVLCRERVSSLFRNYDVAKMHFMGV